MKLILSLSALIIFLGLSEPLFAQTPAIMDANVAWTNNNGIYCAQLTVYLTDSTNVSGVQVKMGAQLDSSNLYTVSYTGATNGVFNNNNVSMTNNNLSMNLGSFSYHSDYYISIKVLMQDNSYKQIAIHSSNN